MRTRFLTLAMIFSLGLFTYSCAEGSQADRDMDEVQQEVSQGMQNLGAEIREESNEFEAEFKEARMNISKRMEEIERDMEDASAEARAEMQEEYNELKAWGSDIDDRMDRVGNNMESGWENFKGDVSKGWKDFSKESRETLNDIERYFDPEGDLD